MNLRDSDKRMKLRRVIRRIISSRVRRGGSRNKNTL